jgi:biopolymer transport protein ExbB/TolQ
LETLLNYFAHSSAVTILVLLVLSVYFILTFWIYLDRYYLLRKRIALESEALRHLYGDAGEIPNYALLYGYAARSKRINRPILEAATSDAMRVSTKGLTWLSIFASTAPFIGLFGTVVGILETFSELGGKNSASLSVVAPAISEALVATAAGIFVAVFAYAFHLLLKRKAYELSSILHSQAEVILAKYEGT